MTATSKDEQHHSDDHNNPHRAWSGVAEAEGFEPPDGRPSLAFKSQGSRVRWCVPGCRPAVHHAIGRTECEADRNRLLHGCYTPRRRSPGLCCSLPEAGGLAKERPD